MSPLTTSVPSASSSGVASSDLIIAAGGLLWRQRKGRREVAVVHRRRYGGDYTLPKGKIKPGETPLQCAVREVREETGCAADPVEFAGPVSYPAEGHPKLVLFWAMRMTHQFEKRDDSEVAEVLWLGPEKAVQQLSYPLERELLARAAGVELRAAPSRLQKFFARFKLRLPAWLHTRRHARLDGAIVTSTQELHWRAVQANQTRSPWAVAARTLLQESRGFLQRGMIQEGWQSLQAARRLEVWAMDDDERGAIAGALRAESDAKLSEWRCQTVAQDLREPVPSRSALRHAQFIVDEHSQNDYRRITLAADHLSSMAVIIGLLLIALLYLASVVPIPVGRAEIEPFELTVYVLIFGMLGGAVSAMVPRDRVTGDKRMPEQLSAATFSKLRPVLGGASALVLYVFVNSGLFPAGIQLTQSIVLLFAFAAGFSERLIVRAITRVADSVRDEREPKTKGIADL